MKKVLAIFSVIVTVAVSGIIGWRIGITPKEEKALTSKEIAKPKPLEKYTIENLSKAKASPGIITIDNIIKEEADFTSYLFSFSFDPSLQGNSQQNKKTTGQVNLPARLDSHLDSARLAAKQAGKAGLPNEKGKYPVILMLRGYVDQQLYKTGDGTRKAAAYFAENGFITIAPDFLGYADSDEEAENIFESRFQTYTTVLSLLESLSTIEQWDKKTIFLWGHSNGGQIALTVLEITKAEYPTTLWAPVSKPFPYSILYYTDESEDRGKLIRRELAEFEDLYDADLYSITEYFEKINAPVQIHQGMADDAVPSEWSNELYNILLNLELDLDLNYYTYPSTDHNMRPNWDTVVSRDLEFFNTNY